MEKCTDTKPAAKNFNKPAYIVFMIAGLCFLIAKDFSNMFIFWGIALVFDPFNTAVPFQKRPLYQRAWLLIHFVLTLAALAYMIAVK